MSLYNIYVSVQHMTYHSLQLHSGRLEHLHM